MHRTPVITLLALALFGCGPGGNQRSATIPQADTPPDPATELASAASSTPPLPTASAALAASAAPAREN